MKKYRVLIIRNAYQQDTGGAEQYAYNLALALKRAGHTPIVVTKHSPIRKKCRVAGILSVKGIWKESQEWSKWYYVRYCLTPIWYAWLILRYRISIVHPQSRDDFVFATRAGHWLRRKIIWTDHADLKYIMDRVNRPHPRMQTWILKAASKTHTIICVSKNERTLIIKVAPELEKKLVVIYNGVFRPKAVVPISKHGKFIIGTNARLVPEKGISELIAAFAIVASKHNEVELWLLGGLSNNEKKYKDQVDNLGIAKSVRFLGYLTNPNDYVASMDIFVHASYHEAFSLAIIEACMLGKPIIATNVGGTPEIINEKSGVLIESKSTEAIVGALEKLIANDKLRNSIASNAQAIAEKEFDFQQIVENKIIPLYERRSR